MQFDESELEGSVDGHERIEFALFGADFSAIDMKVANGIGLELLAIGVVSFNVGQARNAVLLEAAVQRRSGQLRDRRLRWKRARPSQRGSGERPRFRCSLPHEQRASNTGTNVRP